MALTCKTSFGTGRGVARMSFLLALLVLNTIAVRTQCWDGSPLEQSIRILKAENNYDSACFLLSRALNSTESRYRGCENRLDLELAEIYRLTGQYDSALHIIRKLHATPAVALHGDPDYHQRMLYESGTLYLEIGELETGKQYLEDHINLLKARYGSNDAILAPGLNKLGNYYYFRKDLETALEHYQRAMDLVIHRPDKVGESSNYLQNQAIIYSELGEYFKAENHFFKALESYNIDNHNNILNLIKLYINFGKFYLTISAFDKALTYLDSARNAISNNFSTVHPLLGSVLWNQGIIYCFLGDYKKSLSFLLKSYEIHIKYLFQAKHNISLLEMDIALAYKELGNYKSAYQFFKSSLNYSTPLSKIRIYRNLSNYFLSVNQSDSAERYMELCLTSINGCKNANNYDYSLTYLHNGHLLAYNKNEQALDQYRLAYNLLKQTFNRTHREIALTLLKIADFYKAEGQLDSALYYYQESLITCAMGFDNPDILRNPAAEALKLDPYSLAITNHKANALFSKYQETSKIQYLVSSLEAYDLSLYLVEQFDKYFKIDGESKMIFRGEHDQIFKNALMANLAAFQDSGASKYLERAFEINEKSKAAILLSEFRDENAQKLGLIPDSLFQQEREIRRFLYFFRLKLQEEEDGLDRDVEKIQYLRNSLVSYEERYEKLIRLYETAYPDYYRLRFDPSVISIRQVQDMLRDDEAVIEYTLTDHAIVVFLIDPQKVIVEQINTDSALVHDIFAVRNNLHLNRAKDYGYKDFIEFQYLSHNLYQKLMAPIAPGLVGKKKLIIIPDGELAYLSFESLIKKVYLSDSICFRKLPYLINDFSFTYASSATLMHLTSARNNPTLEHGVLAMAPTYSINWRAIPGFEHLAADQPLANADLPGALREAERVAEIMGGKKLTGREATEHRFKELAEHYEILHFAMHTYIDNRNPLSSRLSFYARGDTVEDGYLYTYEIYNMNFSGQLAVLSACSTGDGKLQKGEGVISLARAFAFAGIPSLIMTLWDIEDASSSAIVPWFYQFLKAGYSKDQALRQAKLTYLHRTGPEIEAHPALWSGFVLYGQDESYQKDPVWNLIILCAVLFLLSVALSVIMIRRYHKFRKLREKTEKMP